MKRTKQERICYQTNKLKYHIQRLRALGVPLNQILSQAINAYQLKQ